MPELARIEAVVFLQSVDLFTHCRAEEVLRVAAIADEETFRPDDEIYRPDDAAEALYCVVRGAVRLEAADGAAEVVGPLQTFGVLEILSGRLRTARAVAESETLVLRIRADDLFDLLAHNIEIVRALFRHVILKLQDAD